MRAGQRGERVYVQINKKRQEQDAARIKDLEAEVSEEGRADMGGEDSGQKVCKHKYKHEQVSLRHRSEASGNRPTVQGV